MKPWTNKPSSSKTEDKLRRRPPWPIDSVVNAVFSPCRQYRYELREVWDPKGPLVLWILMNPSTACSTYSDPTLRRTGTFARAWCYGGQLVGNVHAYRATDKRRLLEVDDPIGPKNDETILAMAKEAKTTVLAYGQPPKALRARGAEIVHLLRNHSGLCHLKLAKDGTPIHPLYLPSNLRPIPHTIVTSVSSCRSPAENRARRIAIRNSKRGLGSRQIPSSLLDLQSPDATTHSNHLITALVTPEKAMSQKLRQRIKE